MDLTVVVAVTEETAEIVVVDGAETEVDAVDLTVTLEAQDRVTGSAPTQTVETTTLLGVTSATDARLPSLKGKMAEMMVDSVAADVVVVETVVALEDVEVDSEDVAVDSVADPQWEAVVWTGADVEVAEAGVAQTEWTAVWTGETALINRRKMYSWLPRNQQDSVQKDSGGSKSAQINIDVNIGACLKEDSSSAGSPWPSGILI